jgi:hypothetical protein
MIQMEMGAFQKGFTNIASGPLVHVKLFPGEEPCASGPSLKRERRTVYKEQVTSLRGLSCGWTARVE